MGYRFTVNQKVDSYTHVGEDYKKVEVEQTFTCGTFDDLQNLVGTLVDFSTKPIRLEISKEVVEDV